jgi:hypothetical protein
VCDRGGVENVGGSMSGSGPTTGGILYGGKARLVESDTAYGARRKVGKEICGFGCVGLV